MVANIETLPVLMQQRFGLLSLGGGAMGAIVNEERRGELRTIKQIILELGKDGRISSESDSRWEQIAFDFVQFTRLEALNKDLKKPKGKMPTRAQIVAFLSGLDMVGRVEIVEGCPSSPDDKRLAQLITASVYMNDELVEQIHVSPKLKRDRRYNTKPDSMNRMQQYILCADGSIRDVVTGLEVDKAALRDEMPSLNFQDDEIGDRLVYMSRYVLNLVRGLHFINKQGVVDEWMPNVGSRERDDFLAFASSIPYFIKSGKIDKIEIKEFRQRMMASYLINPKLFKNLAVAFDMQSVFPFFEDIVRAFKMHEDLTMPKSENELIDLIKSTMGRKFDGNMSYLANVAKMFGIGQFWWADEVLE